MIGQNPSSQKALPGSIHTVVKRNSRVVRVLCEEIRGYVA